MLILSDQRGGGGSVVLTVANLPAHNHTSSVYTSGNHSHNIRRVTGYTNSISEPSTFATGCGYYNGKEVDRITSDGNGNHTHRVDIGNTGSSRPVNIMNPYLSVNI